MDEAWFSYLFPILLLTNMGGCNMAGFKDLKINVKMNLVITLIAILVIAVLAGKTYMNESEKIKADVDLRVVEHVEIMSQQNAATAEQMASTAISLADQAGNMNKTMEYFKLKIS